MWVNRSRALSRQRGWARANRGTGPNWHFVCKPFSPLTKRKIAVSGQNSTKQQSGLQRLESKVRPGGESVVGADACAQACSGWAARTPSFSSPCPPVPASDRSPPEPTSQYLVILEQRRMKSPRPRSSAPARGTRSETRTAGGRRSAHESVNLRDLQSLFSREPRSHV